MQIHFKGTNYEIPSAVTALATKKLQGLRKYLGKGKNNTFTYVDLGKEAPAHQTGRIWYADITCDANGTRFYAKALEESIEVAIDKAVAELGRELQRARRRQQSLVRRGGALFKALLQGKAQA